MFELVKSNFSSLYEYKIKFKESETKVIEELIKLLNQVMNELEGVKSNLQPLANKSKQAQLLKEKMRMISEEKSKLLQIKSEQLTLKDMNEKFKNILNNVVENYAKIEALYIQCANELKSYSGVSDELDISIQVRFNNNQLNGQIESNRANKPSLKRLFPSMINSEDSFEYTYSREHHVRNLRKFLQAIMKGTLKMNLYGNPKQLAKAIFEDNFYLNFVISYQQDTLDLMSPGKKNLVVLKLLIELNNSEYPILIDQPEDDLDNRSIYDDLVQFILKKKGKRQIILVTHNPNVVVGTDSENTIVANQEGQTSGRTNKKYKFEYCNGAIEKSFINSSAKGILFKKGIKEHICDILEGGEKAFKEREARYSFMKE